MECDLQFDRKFDLGMTIKYYFHARNEFSGINLHKNDISHAYGNKTVNVFVVLNDHICYF